MCVCVCVRARVKTTAKAAGLYGAQLGEDRRDWWGCLHVIFMTVFLCSAGDQMNIVVSHGLWCYRWS